VKENTFGQRMCGIYTAMYEYIQVTIRSERSASSYELFGKRRGELEK